MGKTVRRSPLDTRYGCFEGYLERRPTMGRICRRGDSYYDARDRKIWEKRNRDGTPMALDEALHGGKEEFRRLSRRYIRRETRRLIARGMDSGDWDDLAFPTQWDGKKFIWTVW